MRLLTAISIVSLVVSIAAVVFVLGLYAELEESKPDTPLVKKVHTQELNETMVTYIITDHILELIKLAGITEDNINEKVETLRALPGYWCFWHETLDEDLTYSTYPWVIEPNDGLTYNYIKEYDVWLATSYGTACGELTTWAIDDNTGEVTYGHPDEK